MLLFVSVAAGCRKDSAPTGGAAPSTSAHADEPPHDELPKRVRLASEVAHDAKIETTKVTKEVLVPVVSLPGEVAADVDNTARISSPVSGRIERVLVKEGAAVKKGDALMELRVPDLGKVRGAHAATIAKARAAHANATRLEELYKSKLATEQAYLDARAEAEALDADARALADQLAAFGTGEAGRPFFLMLRAPKDGVVVARDAIVGQPVAPENVLATVSDLQSVWFLARVFEKDLARVHVGAHAEIALNAFPMQPFPATVEFVTQQIDPIARTVTARLRVANEKAMLRIGLFGTADVATGEPGSKPALLVVPRTAVTEIAGKPVVFVAHPDGDYELHEVVLGDAALGKIEIVSGLREGELVVHHGAFSLKSLVLKGTLAEEE